METGEIARNENGLGVKMGRAADDDDDELRRREVEEPRAKRLPQDLDLFFMCVATGEVMEG
jgi:hypothetical protein